MAFFDKIGQTISDGVSSVSGSTKSMAETSKLNSQINTLRGSVRKTYEEMGQYYYNNREGGVSTEALDNMCAEIDRMNGEIRDLELKVKLAKGIVPCSNCGADVSINSAFCSACGTRVTVPSPNTDDVPAGKKKCLKCGSIENADTKFCSSCGTRMPEEVAAPKEEAPKDKVCPNCGITMPAEMKFCSNCGTKIEDAPAPQVETPEPAAEEAPSPEPVAESTASIAEAAPDEPASEETSEETPAETSQAEQAPEVVSEPEPAPEPAPAPSAADSIVCSKCGRVEPSGMRFCSECGNKL